MLRARAAPHPQAAKATLPVPYREDGPPLAFEFDPIPLSAPAGVSAGAAAGGGAEKRPRAPSAGGASAAEEGGEEGEEGAAAKRARVAAGTPAPAPQVTGGGGVMGPE